MRSTPWSAGVGKLRPACPAWRVVLSAKHFWQLTCVARSMSLLSRAGQVLPEVLLSSVKLLGARHLRPQRLQKQEALPCWRWC